MVQFYPERLVELLGKAVGVRADNGDIAFLWVRVVFRGILFNVELEGIVLRICGRLRILADIRCGNDVHRHVENRLHAATLVVPGCGDVGRPGGTCGCACCETRSKEESSNAR